MAIFKKIKDKIVGSATLQVAGGMVGLGVLIQQYPDIINIVPENYRPLVLSLFGVVVAIARLRTLGK